MTVSNSGDDRILAVLDQLLALQTAGKSISVDVVLKDHPDLADQPDVIDEIRTLWATMMLAENLGSFAFSEESIPIENESAAPVPEEFGDYELLQEIGRGGMGVVYRARQKSLNRIVAVKMLLRPDLTHPRNLARFRSEAEWLAGLDHPNIIGVFEVGETNGQPFFSMPLVDGTTLSDQISNGPFENQQAVRLLIPVCRAIAHAHREGILHRDLKPSNILLDLERRPYVSDFGLAKRLPNEATPDPDHTLLTESGAIIGTPGYMAPEQAVGDRGEISQATDVYALGAILYAILCGRAPFTAPTPVDALLMILEQDPPPPRILNPKIDFELELIILKAMQKPADLRYESADKLADDLEAYLLNEPISARSSQFTQVLSRAFRPTHHIGVLENWGLLWMWHAAVLLMLCLATDVSRWNGIESRMYYLLMWSVGLSGWAAIFWNLRRRAGPVTFVERQIAHVWAASMVSSSALYVIEYLLGMDVLTLSPVLALITGTVFTVKAGILSGEFYIPAAILFFTSIPMAFFPTYAVTIFGVVASGAFFLSGLKFYLAKRAG